MAALPFIMMAVSAVGAIQQANAASNAAKSQAYAADYNAQVSRNQAQQSLQVSAAEQLAHRRKVEQFMGVQRAAVAQSGTGFEGSNDDIIEQSGTLAEMEALNLAYAGQLRSQGFASQSVLDAYQAGAYRRNASAERTGGYLRAATAIGSGLSRMYGGTQAPAPIEERTIVGAGSFYGISPRSGIGLRFG